MGSGVLVGEGPSSGRSTTLPSAAKMRPNFQRGCASDRGSASPGGIVDNAARTPLTENLTQKLRIESVKASGGCGDVAS